MVELVGPVPRRVSVMYSLFTENEITRLVNPVGMLCGGVRRTVNLLITRPSIPPPLHGPSRLQLHAPKLIALRCIK